MRLVLSKSITGHPLVVEAIRQLAVYDGDDLLALMWERDDGSTALTRIGEEDFERLVREMGLEKRSDVRTIKVPA